ncbi:DUF4416 family protein [Blastopirellula sp. JC732]|uniref:DUF4416 family protein n=1 Tax=Blastopirellula sediminis TaxID=2894196 RepID=A0A9X1MQX5_9BACT|nr:DUF4416 family protein [Blastopirellula sediminis]MCC9605936.1 DUF4416 family protein [Blastopirellula sediminis]MCC9630765.1 DUF4416 family protein [Blastopirellula sediminis]
MGDLKPPRFVLRIVAAFSRHDEALEWGKSALISQWGPIALESPHFDLVETNYYDNEMGPGLKKCFWAFAELADSSLLADWKLQSNDLEVECQQLGRWPESRPLNLDPGYITEAKLVLATTKDRSHRIYLRDGIFAEVTLQYHQKRWTGAQWTYPDYQRADFQAFFDECRGYLRQQLRQNPA